MSLVLFPLESLLRSVRKMLDIFLCSAAVWVGWEQPSSTHFSSLVHCGMVVYEKVMGVKSVNFPP